MTVAINLKQLYETDYYEWLDETIRLLKNQQLEAIDYENLIEELEDLGNEQKRAAESFLEQIIRHLLMYQYWLVEREKNANHWEAEIFSFRNQLNRRLTTNLINYLQLNLDGIYQDALGYVIRKTKLNNLSKTCFYSWEQLLNKDWLPQI